MPNKKTILVVILIILFFGATAIFGYLIIQKKTELQEAGKNNSQEQKEENEKEKKDYISPQDLKAIINKDIKIEEQETSDSGASSTQNGDLEDETKNEDIQMEEGDIDKQQLMNIENEDVAN